MRYRLEGFSEVDRAAIDSYCAVHKTTWEYNLGDVTKMFWNTMESPSMICGGSPCQDFSVAGKGKGNVYKCVDCGHEWNPLTVHWMKRKFCPKCGCNRIEGTRSSLICHYLQAVRILKPKFGIYENVKALTNKNHWETFDCFVRELEDYGYNVYHKVLDASDYGIPQHRERLILVYVRKDLDNGKFRFPEPIGCRYPVLALMDEDVPESMYITGEKVEKFLEGYFSKEHRDGSGVEAKNLVFTGGFGKLRTKEPKGQSRDYRQGNRVYDSIGVGSALSAQPVGGLGNETSMYLVQSGYINNNADANRIYESRGIARSLKAEAGGGGAKTGWYLINAESDGTCRTVKANYHKVSLANFKRPKDMGATGVAACHLAAVRKLTPKECWRLMGFDDADFEAAKSTGVSNTQLYKQAGNSIVVDVLYYVLKSLRTAIPELFDDLSVLSLFSGIGAFEKALSKLGGPMEHDWDWEAHERMEASKKNS